MTCGGFSPGRASRRLGVAVCLAIAALAWGIVALPEVRGRETRPNVVVIVADDQTADSIPNATPVMPWLQERALDPGDHWVVFERAFVNTPLCCPSRATMLSGRYSHSTGVLDNDDAELLDDGNTLVSWLHDAGYHTGLVGKYVNGYPFGRLPFVPVGWDRWWAKEQGPATSLYYDYTLIEQGLRVAYGSDHEDYATDVFAAKAVEFIREAPTGRPFLLWFAPTAPHPTSIPAPRHAGALADASIPMPPSVGEGDVSDKPSWIRELAPADPAAMEVYRSSRRSSYEALRAVDDAVRAIVDALQTRGALGRTVIVYTSDNGVAFGEHRWTMKSCAYDACLRVPFLMRMPGVEHRIERAIISTVDLAPTIAELARIEAPRFLPGASLVGLVRSGIAGGRPHEVFAEWLGDDPRVPRWWAVRTSRFAYVELATGERELYALWDDPFELVNVIDDPRYATAVERLSTTLDGYRDA